MSMIGVAVVCVTLGFIAGVFFGFLAAKNMLRVMTRQVNSTGVADKVPKTVPVEPGQVWEATPALPGSPFGRVGIVLYAKVLDVKEGYIKYQIGSDPVFKAPGAHMTDILKILGDVSTKQDTVETFLRRFQPWNPPVETVVGRVLDTIEAKKVQEAEAKEKFIDKQLNDIDPFGQG